MEPDFTGNEDIQRFAEHFRRNPDSLVFARLADAFRKAGDPERALEILRDGIRRHPDYASAHIVRARALEDLERPSEAEASLRRVLELDAQNLVAMRGLAELAERRGDPIEAVHWFERIVAHDPANREAEDALERLRKTLPETPPGLEPLPAPREEWWSTPAFEIADEAQAEEEPGGTPDEEPMADEASAPDEPAAEPAGSRGGSAWWFEDPAGNEPAEDDGDLLTRTMAELYVKQGLVEEAAAIYRELLADRPGDEEIRRVLAELEADGGSAGVDDETVSPQGTEAEPVRDEGAGPQREPDDEDVEPADEPGPPAAPDAEVDATPAAADATVAADPYASHPVPASAARSEAFRDWIARLRT